jgi:hypothetical protein
VSDASPITIDRIQLSVVDRPGVAARWQELLDASVVREDAVKALGCRRTVLAVGTSEVELLEADGAGPVHEAGPGLFAAGFASRDPDALASRLADHGVELARENGQVFVTPEALGGSGLRLVISPVADRERQGLLSRLYEVTNLVTDPKSWSARFARLFDLDESAFVPIQSDNFGYEGTLTLFRAGVLDRVEIIHPYDRAKTMGRFHERHGECLYMCYSETDRADDIRDRARAHAPDDWTGPAEGSVDNLFLHPRALGGVMLGVSRTTHAWTWSGAPERVEPVPAS